MSRLLYNLAVLLALPVVSLAVAWRGLRDPAWWRSWPERFRSGGSGTVSPPLWVHAASVGEVQVAATLIGALRQSRPDLPVLLTTATPAGRARAMQLCPDARVRLVPYDLPWLMARHVRRTAPVALVIIETELWPNLLHACAAGHVPVLLTSARVSARSAARLARFPALLAPAWRARVTVLAQSESDAGRFRALGVPAERVSVGGNLKFDFAVPADVPAAGQALRAALAPGRALWVAGSTHAGEESAALQAQRAVLATGADALLVIAPRHSARFAEVARLIESSGLSCARRSQGESAAAVQVLLLDTIGELLLFYAAADLAFVGGSLVPVGGHNLLEPAALRVAIVTGRYQFNAPDICARLLAAGALAQVDSADGLAGQVRDLLAAPARRAELARAAAGVVAAERGALARSLGALSECLSAPRA